VDIMIGKSVLREDVGFHHEAWPVGARFAKLRAWGGGGSGGGSKYPGSPGGAGASACYIEKWLQRPINGITAAMIRPGGRAIGAGVNIDGESGGQVDFSDDTNGLWGAGGGGGGQPATNTATGGDGGAGGVPFGDVDFYTRGGMGDASQPGTFPRGADCPGAGGSGSCNGQSGMIRGGGGAGGTVEFPSGEGGCSGYAMEFYS
jgi:hypothetical protein